MCLKVKNSNPYIAEKDIEVYKVFMKETICDLFKGPKRLTLYYAPFNTNYYYSDLNGTYFCYSFDGYKDSIFPFYIDYGFHSFKNFTDAVWLMDDLNKINGNKERFSYEIIPCIIPKGTEYFEGYSFDDKESYCSQKIKLNY